MYDFVDTDENSNVVNDRPAEALKFNGTYIEDVVSGYRTLSVSGRETISSEISETESEASDGTRYLYRRYKPRTIIVTYQLLAPDAAAFRDAFNKLNALLDAEEAELIFNDEQDKYFTGTKLALGDIDAGTNKVVGEIEFYCTDPFKYSTTERTVAAEDGVITIDYNGAYKCYPILEADITSEVENISYNLESGASILIGNLDSIIGTGTTKSETLVNETLTSSLSSNWTLNTANDVFTTTYAQTGTTTFVTTAKGTGVSGNSYGSGSYWHGPSITIKIPADSTGHTGASDYIITWNSSFIAAVKEVGAMQILATGYDSSGNDVNIASVTYSKTTQSSRSTYCGYGANGSGLGGFSYTANAVNSVSGTGFGDSTIRMLNNRLTFHIGDGYQFGFDVPDLDGIELREVSICFAKWSSESVAAMNVSKVMVSTIGTYSTSTGFEIAEGDTIIADCSTGEITVNGTVRTDAGEITNNWEEFYLSPGTNEIECVYPDDATSTPEFVCRYKEVYL